MLLMSWAIWALVLGSVWVYSYGEAWLGNWLTLGASSLGMIYFIDKLDPAFFLGHMVLFSRTAWMIHKEVGKHG